jgi:hypothetical protein
MLRGIPEKGMDYDPRNMTLHIFQGIGNVGGALSSLADSMGTAISVFSGPFISAFINIAPDHTAAQLNRLSDSAFASNTLVDKLQTKVFSVFIPEALILTPSQQGTYWGHTRRLLNLYPLDQVDVCVDGTLVTPVAGTDAPTFSITDTSIGTDEALTLKAAADATIYYTTNGQTPTTTSPKFSSPISFATSQLGSTQTVQAIAVEASKAQSAVVSRSYLVVPAKPVITASGTTLPITLTMTSPTNGASILYTDGAGDPTTPLPATGYTLTTAKTVKAVAQLGALKSKVATYTYPPPAPAATPTFTPAAGSYSTAQTVTISDTTAGATIYYTINGNAPTITSAQYIGPISVATTETINAIAVAAGSSNSAVGTAAYKIGP